MTYLAFLGKYLIQSSKDLRLKALRVDFEHMNRFWNGDQHTIQWFRRHFNDLTSTRQLLGLGHFFHFPHVNLSGMITRAAIGHKGNGRFLTSGGHIVQSHPLLHVRFGLFDRLGNACKGLWGRFYAMGLVALSRGLQALGGLMHSDLDDGELIALVFGGGL